MNVSVPVVRSRLGLLFLCREGFESDVAAELGACLESARDGELPAGYLKAQKNAGFAEFLFSGAQAAPRFSRDMRSVLGDLVFSRQTLLALGVVTNLPESAKAAPLANGCFELFQQAFPVPGLAPQVHDVVLEAPDTNAGKEFAGFCRSFAPHLRRALDKAFAGFGKVSEARDPTLPRPVNLHVFFTGWNECVVALSLRGVSSPLAGGIPRLKFPSAAPSRSTLKLEEAFLTFLDDNAQRRWLRAGLRAVDLGACPGGWTYQFVRREMHVTAIDNGSIAPSLLSTGLVEHLREDGFRYRPRKPVEWMVCDMVEKPTRVAKLAAEWIAQGHAMRTVFNLKLPMKARFAEVAKCLLQVEGILSDAGLVKGQHYVLKCRQLFHDREEVTCYLGRLDAK